VENKEGYVNVAFSPIVLLGKGSATGLRTEGVYARLHTIDMQEYSNITSKIELEYKGKHANAWFDYFNRTLSRAYKVTNFEYEEEYDGSSLEEKEVETVHYEIELEKEEESYELEVEIRNSVLPIHSFFFDIAYFEVIVGNEER